MKIDTTLSKRQTKIAVILTDEHATSSYGQPVVVIAGQAYSYGDVYDGLPLLLSAATTPRSALSTIPDQRDVEQVWAWNKAMKTYWAQNLGRARAIDKQFGR